MQQPGVFLGLVFLAACGSTSPLQTTAALPIEPAVSASLRSNLAAQATSLSGPAALLAQAAALALQAGVQSNTAPLTMGLYVPAGTSIDAVQRSGALSSAATPEAFAFQLTVIPAQEGLLPRIYSGVLAFQGATQAVLSAGPSPVSDFPPAVGLLVERSVRGDLELWEATEGQTGAQLRELGGSCLAGLPGYVKGCNFATFTNAGFNIPGSTPAAGGAVGMMTAFFPSARLIGVAMTLDCAQTSLCRGPSVTRIQPDSGSTAGGTSVIIAGANFWPGATVRFGTAPANDAIVQNSESISATTPVGVAGSADVTVTNADGQMAVLRGGFNYVATGP